MRFPLDLLRKY